MVRIGKELGKGKERKRMRRIFMQLDKKAE